MEQTAASRLIMGLELKSAEIAGDFEELVAIYRPRIFRFALASLRDRDAAETITQDCFLNAYRARERFRNDCSVQTWLMQIAVNLIRDYGRNRRLQFWKRTRTAPPLEDLGARAAVRDRSAESQVLLSEQVQAIWNAAAALPEKQRSGFSVAVCGGHGSAGDRGGYWYEGRNGEDSSFPVSADRTGADWSQAMSEHLSSRRIDEAIIGASSLEAQRHLRECSSCQAEVAQVQEPLASFRHSVRAWTGEQLPTRARTEWGAQPTRMWTPFSRLSLAMVAVALCLLVALSWSWNLKPKQ